ncbi:hypothetical protein MHU86_5979 [Fragilaria crotonensis]|nr:hypothetical protein MHU86_5979 [Fragilaria crotonensis]
MMAMMTMSQAQMKRPGRNSVAALTRRSRSWIRPDNAEPLRWFRGRYTQWITMQYTESVIVRVGARWTLTPTHAWQEVIAWFSSIPGDQLRSRLIRLITRRSRFLSQRLQRPTIVRLPGPRVVAGFDSRPPTQDELDNTALHVELTSDVEWIPPHLRALARGGGCVGLRRRRGDYELASKALEGPTLQGNETEDQELHAGSCSEPVPLRNANRKRSKSAESDRPDTAKGRSTYDDSGCELGGDWHCGDTNWRCDFRCNPRKCGTTLDGWIRDGKELLEGDHNKESGRYRIQRRDVLKLRWHICAIKVEGMFYADIMEPKIKSIDSQRYAHIIGNGRGYTKAYPMERKNESIYALDDFVKKVEFQKYCCAITTPQWKDGASGRRGSERVEEDDPKIPRQDAITKKTLELSRQPLRKDQILRCGTHPDLQGRSAFEQVHGWTPDISLYVMHGWYEVISYLDNDNERKLACWLGPAEDYGGGDAAFLLPKSAKPIVRSTFWALTPDERADRREEIAELLESIEEKIGISGQTRRWRKSLVKISFPG